MFYSIPVNFVAISPSVAPSRSSPERSPAPVVGDQHDKTQVLGSTDVKQVVIHAVLIAVSLNNEVNGSQHNFMNMEKTFIVKVLIMLL